MIYLDVFVNLIVWMYNLIYVYVLKDFDNMCVFTLPHLWYFSTKPHSSFLCVLVLIKEKCCFFMLVISGSLGLFVFVDMLCCSDSNRCRPFFVFVCFASSYRTRILFPFHFFLNYPTHLISPCIIIW